ncbi:MAG TPA: hypothetical protein VD962_06210 [Rubricoccaceae bacterium]|nr:hypothetical protein [Rubricoccaceae bacterium]
MSSPAPEPPAPEGAVHYVPFIDPTEQAFRVEVPAGWHVQGGIDRSTGEGLLRLHLASPDGQIQIRVPDAPPRTFYVPSLMLASAGYVEGTQMGAVAIQRFIPGVDYARLHAERQVAPGLGVQGAHLLGQRDRPDLAQGPQAPGAQVSVGEVWFGGTLAGRPVEVHVQATCSLFPSTMGGSWTAFTGAYFAPPERAAEAAAVVAHAQRSWQLNPQWQHREQQRRWQQDQRTLQAAQAAASRAATQGAAQRAAIWRESTNAIGDMITGGYEAQQASYDQTFQNHANAFRGTADVTDPVHGVTYNIWDEAHHYWVDNGGTIVVTDEGWDNPDPTRFRPMSREE